MSVKVTGVHDGPLSRFRWGLVARQWTDQVEPLVKEALRKKAPVGRGPGAGRLRDSIRSQHTVSAANTVVTFTASVPYAGFVIDGTAAHDIRPRHAQALHWVGPGGSVFARLVHHPGTRPNPFPELAIRPLAADIQARLEAAVAEQLKP